MVRVQTGRRYRVQTRSITQNIARRSKTIQLLSNGNQWELGYCKCQRCKENLWFVMWFRNHLKNMVLNEDPESFANDEEYRQVCQTAQNLYNLGPELKEAMQLVPRRELMSARARAIRVWNCQETSQTPPCPCAHYGEQNVTIQVEQIRCSRQLATLRSFRNA
jgi:hypothetical protein